MLDTYYDMLTTQKRPFNRTKGAIVTPLVIGVQPCQKMCQVVPTSKLSTKSLKADDQRVAKSSSMSPRSISEIPGLGKKSNMKVETALNKTMSKDVSNLKSLAKTSILNKESMRSDLNDVSI